MENEIDFTEIQKLLPVSQENGKEAISARLLHAFLESKQDFSDWIKNRIKKYDFVENQDFEVFHNFMENPSGGRPLTEYALSLDCAKEISMVEGNAKGKLARKYFIWCEKRANQKSKPLSPAEQLLYQAQLMVEHEKRIENVESKLHVLDARTTTRPDFFTIAGYGTLHHTPVNYQLACTLGKRAASICRKQNIQMDTIEDPRWGKVRMYPRFVLDEVFSQPIN